MIDTLLVQDAMVTTVAGAAGVMLVRRVFGVVWPSRRAPACAGCRRCPAPPSAATAGASRSPTEARQRRPDLVS
jgi:hypothetical protein